MSVPMEKGSGVPMDSNTVMLVTGGAGFIGANFIRFVLEQTAFPGKIVNLDALTYAGNPASLSDIERRFEGRYVFVQGDIRDNRRLEDLFGSHVITVIVHFAAESHVDRSIHGPAPFIETNISGTFQLLETARRAWQGKENVRFHHISTDEVYGSLGATGRFEETTAYDPRSPYSASKAASDHLARAYQHTYGLPVTVSNCSNNYGPYQFPEKLIPLILLNALAGKQLPVYGDGKNVRDWLFVTDHCEAIWNILEKGRVGQTYNIGGECEMQNIEVVRTVCSVLEEFKPSPARPYDDLIEFVTDRPGHDRRYAVNCDKIKRELGWQPRHVFRDGMRETVRWYLSNGPWVDSVRSGEYQKWIERNYAGRSTR